MLFLLQRWWILLLWYNLASPEWCYVLNNALVFLLMLVIRTIGRSEYKLHLRIQFFKFYLQILVASIGGFLGATSRMYSSQLSSRGWGRQVCLNSLHFPDLAKPFYRVPFALSVPGFQNHTLCSPCHNLDLLGMQKCLEVSLPWASLPDLIVLVAQHEAAEEYHESFKIP